MKDNLRVTGKLHLQFFPNFSSPTGNVSNCFCMKTRSSSTAREEYVRFHTTTSSHVVYPPHHVHWQSDKAFMRQILCAQNINCPRMAGLKKKEGKSRWALTPFPSRGPHLQKELPSVQSWIITLILLTQIFCLPGTDGLTFHLIRAAASTPSIRHPVEIELFAPR